MVDSVLNESFFIPWPASALRTNHDNRTFYATIGSNSFSGDAVSLDFNHTMGGHCGTVDPFNPFQIACCNCIQPAGSSSTVGSWRTVAPCGRSMEPCKWSQQPPTLLFFPRLASATRTVRKSSCFPTNPPVGDGESIAVSGSVAFSEQVSWPVTLIWPGVMGWFAWMPFMECYHGVISFDHALKGSLSVERRRQGYVDVTLPCIASLSLSNLPGHRDV